MAQAISNTLQSTNPLAGLLGLNPKPLAGLNVGGQTTPSAALFKPNTSLNVAYGGPSNVATGQYTNNPVANLGTMGTAGVIKPPAVTSNVNTSGGSIPLAPTGSTAAATFTPSGLPITGNPATYAGIGNTSTAPVAPTRGLFPDVLSSLAYGSADRNATLGKNAQDIAAEYGQKIADVGGQGARFEAGQRTTGTTPVAEGNAAVTAQTVAAQQAALAAGETAALTGNAQAITAQGQTQSAQSSAAGLAQPYPTAYGQTSFNPATGQFDGGGSLPAEVMQQYAQMAATGQYAAIPGFITSNPVLNAQLNVAAKALNPSYTPLGSQGAGNVLQGIPALQSANTAADGIKNTIQGYLQSNPTLNPSDLAAGNMLQQWIQGKQLTDPKYQTLFNYLNEYTNTLAPILGVGGDPTNLKTQIAQGFVNAAASGQSISQVLEAMSTLATNKITDLQSGATGGGTSVPAPQNGGTGSGGLYDW